MNTKLIALAAMIAALFLPVTGLHAQEAANNLKFFWVSFADKADSPYSVERPEEFLSARAIARRAQRGIPVTAEDLPPNPAYVEALAAKGALIHHTSRWLNAATILIAEEQIVPIADLPFVDTIFYAGPAYDRREQQRPPVQMDSLLSRRVEDEPYGHGATQIRLLKGDTLHQLGYTGSSKLIAVLDGGFIGVEESPFFDSLRAAGRLLPGRNFVNEGHPYALSTHGSKVLSTMASNVPGVLVGTAPGAAYVCVKTEDTRTEYRIEECNWVAGLEFADSLGADIINSSLGYTTFDDKGMNYQYDHLDGQKSVASRAADIAAAKGMMVITSAGNEGSSKWRHIGIPADAELAFSIGATDLRGKRASFSSVGPTPDGRIKPDVVAPGAWVATADAYSFRVAPSSGTSFASPILAGLAACLWEAFPEKTNLEIMDAIRQSGSMAASPDAEIGFGLPDFGKAFRLLKAAAAPSSPAAPLVAPRPDK
jgi:serine protease AprX